MTVTMHQPSDFVQPCWLLRLGFLLGLCLKMVSTASAEPTYRQAVAPHYWLKNVYLYTSIAASTLSNELQYLKKLSLCM